MKKKDNYEMRKECEVMTNLCNACPHYFGYAKENIEQKFSQNQYDSIVTWKCNRGKLPEDICGLVEKNVKDYES